MMAPKSKEPEDMFNDLEKDGPEPASHGEDPVHEASSPGKGLRVALIAVGSLAALAVLGIGGYFIYDRFANPLAPVPAVTSPTPEVPAPTPTTPEPTEAPPAVEPTPLPPEAVEPITPPDAIPPPTAVTPGAPVDTDGDGLTDEQEAARGTDASVADTDGDGLTDGEEVSVQLSNPAIADSDGDGLTDGDEVRVWRTSPTTADTDADGYSDGQEVQNGFNPNGSGKLPTP
jgi:hypothetical protein